MKGLKVVFAALALFFAATIAQGANLYRYIDDNGTVVLDRSIPPEYVSKGYVILNEQGAVLKIVPPALTENQKLKLRAEKQRVAIEEARDKELLKLYRSPEDVDRAMNAWMSRLEVEISLKKNQLSIKRSELAEIQSEAAELERTGKTVTPEILQQLAVVDVEIKEIIASIDLVKQRIEEDTFMFELDKARVSEITGIKAKPTDL